MARVVDTVVFGEHILSCLVLHGVVSSSLRRQGGEHSWHPPVPGLK